VRELIVVDIHNDDGERGEGYGGGSGPGEVPAGKPGVVGPGFRGSCGEGLGGFFDGRKREEDDAAAVRAMGEVGEGLLILVSGEGLLCEGAELVGIRMAGTWMIGAGTERIGMVAGLEEFAHFGSEFEVGVAV